MENDNYNKLRELLAKNKAWPLLYMFKFIVPNSDDKVKQVAEILTVYGEISYRHTKNLTYVSVTCIASMNSVESIINVNKKIAIISGVIML